MVATQPKQPTGNIIERYAAVMQRMLGTQFPNLTQADIIEAINYSLQKRYQEEECVVSNNYNKQNTDMTLLELTEYILDREPIYTGYGCLWKRKGKVPNPLVEMVRKFMESRGIYKKEMFKHPKGSEDFQKYNLLQLLA